MICLNEMVFLLFGKFVKAVALHRVRGLQDVKCRIRQFVEWPLDRPGAFKRLGISRVHGSLLYGPPGCSKTTLMRAAASSTHARCIELSASDVYSMCAISLLAGAIRCLYQFVEDYLDGC